MSPEEIVTDLRRIETIHGARMLYAVESGSRVWGFHSQNSDYDVRFIYLRPISWYLSINERRDVIEPPIRGLLDSNGWDLKKALQLLSRSNPPLLEWLASPTIYLETPSIGRLRELAADYFNPRSAIYHYLHMANGNYRSYLKGAKVPLKKYFYVIRPLLACAWIHKFGGCPPVRLRDLLAIADWPQEVKESVLGLLHKKQSGLELSMAPRIDSLNAWIETKLELFGDLARTTAIGKNKIDDLNDFLLNALYSEVTREWSSPKTPP